MEQLLEKARIFAFWGLDFLKGGAIRKHYKDIKILLENFNSEHSQNKRASYLQDLLKHAVTTTNFYSEYDKFKDLTDFPIINKIVLRDHSKDMFSRDFRDKSTYKMSSSGSTGITTTAYQDKRKRDRNTADIFYFQEKAGFTPGYRLYYLRKWLEKYKKSGLTTWMRNIVMVDVTTFNDAYIAELISKMEKDRSTKVILAYSSALREICNYLERTNAAPLNTNFSCIIAMAESISDQTRTAVKNYFKTEVVSRYSNLENGIFGLQFPDMGQGYHLNWASYYFEILNLEDDTAVAPGELGRVVITDLFNYNMPIIRYDTGDLAILSYDNEYFNAAPIFTTVVGRKMDVIYDTTGKPRSSFIVAALEAYQNVKQFQLIQEGQKNYTIKLNIDNTFEHEEELIKIYREYLGNDAQIRFDYVNEIPLLASGKRRLTVNNYYK
ncbi:MAG: CoF synthetase [Flavobacteriaceae bacterium]